MCDTLIDTRLDLFERRRVAYQNEAEFWRPEHTEEALLVRDFEEFLAKGVRYWEYLCRMRDDLLDHDMQCQNDHAANFAAIDLAMRSFFDRALEVAKLVESVESKDYTVDHAEEFRTAVSEARVFTSTYDGLEATRTPIAEWE